MMNRRGFLGGLFGTVAALTLDPEKLLWVPGKKLISIPKRNQILTIEMVSFAMLKVLHNNTIAMRKINGDYHGLFSNTGAKIGDVVVVRRPPHLLTYEGKFV